jgi:hypothetical protein
VSRQKPDACELRPRIGPLFDPPAGHLYAPDDQATSREAAHGAVATGLVGADARYLLDLIAAHPGETMETLGAIAARERGGDPFQWRIKLGRRTGTLLDAGAVHARGKHDGKALWWPGRKPDGA